MLQGAPLTAAEVRALDLTCGPHERLNTSVVLLRGEVAVHDDPGTWWSDHADRVRARLSALGWRGPADSEFRDVAVQIDREGRIGVGP